MFIFSGIDRSRSECISSIPRRLSELLASAESPTASKEDIEKSGLEVFQASSIQEYESSGRVASNCTEKVDIPLQYQKLRPTAPYIVPDLSGGLYLG